MLREVADIKACVGFLYGSPDEFDDPEPYGTCFFAEYYDSAGAEPSGPYLITAKHVWKKLEEADEAFVRVWNPDGGEERIPLDTAEDQWLFHDDRPVDVAVQVWTRDRWYGHAVDLTFWPTEPLHMPAPSTNFLREGETAVFVGLMTDFPGERKNLAMLRDGMIGLVPDEPISTEDGPSDYFVVNVQSYKGNSGAPVFLAAAGFHLIGVLTYGFYEEAAGGRSRGWPRNYNLGVSLVTPIEKVEEIMKSDAEKARRVQSKREVHGEPLDGGEPGDLTKEAMEAALRRVSRPDGKAVIEKRDEASSET